MRFRLHFLHRRIDVFEHLVAATAWSATKNLGFNQNHTVIGDYITQNLMVTLYILIGIHFAIDAPSWTKDILASASGFGRLPYFFLTGKNGLFTHNVCRQPFF